MEEAVEGMAEDLAHPAGEAPETEVEAQLAAVTALDSGSDSEEEENTGQWSPRPLAAAVVAGQDVVGEEDDRRLLELLRAQVRPARWDCMGCGGLCGLSGRPPSLQVP